MVTYDNVNLSGPSARAIFIHGDWLGTERARSLYNGTPYQTCTNLPFGDQQNCPTFDGYGDPSPLHFTGKMRDTETNLDYFGARYDASALGRFMSPDPLGGNLSNPQSLNRYSYAINNPLVFTDPTGMYVCKDSLDCSSKQDQAFEKTLSSLRNSKDADVARAAGAYGAANSDNGVSVGFANLSGAGKNGDTVSTIGAHEDGSLYAKSDVTINSKASGTDYSVAVGHEGSHIADAQDVVKSGVTEDGSGIHAGQNITPYQSEQRAFGVTNTILSQGNESRTLSCGSATCKLGAGVNRGQVPGIVDQILSTNSVYNQGGKPMTPSNQGQSVVNGISPTPPKLTLPQ